MLPELSTRIYAQDTHPQGVAQSRYDRGDLVAWADALPPEDEEQDAALDWSWGLIAIAPVYINPDLLPVPVRAGWWYCLLNIDAVEFQPRALIWCHETQIEQDDHPMHYCCSESTGCEQECFIDARMIDLHRRWHADTLVQPDQVPSPPWVMPTLSQPLMQPTIALIPAFEPPMPIHPVVLQQPQLERSQSCLTQPTLPSRKLNLLQPGT